MADKSSIEDDDMPRGSSSSSLSLSKKHRSSLQHKSRQHTRDALEHVRTYAFILYNDDDDDNPFNNGYNTNEDGKRAVCNFNIQEDVFRMLSLVHLQNIPCLVIL